MPGPVTFSCSRPSGQVSRSLNCPRLAGCGFSLKHSVYACQAGRAFLSRDHATWFQRPRKIEAEVPLVLDRRHNVPFTREGAASHRRSGHPLTLSMAGSVERMMASSERGGRGTRSGLPAQSPGADETHTCRSRSSMKRAVLARGRWVSATCTSLTSRTARRRPQIGVRSDDA
jgi:hypothetical protein